MILGNIGEEKGLSLNSDFMYYSRCFRGICIRSYRILQNQSAGGVFEAITSQSKGLYSNRLPLIPIVVSVDRFGEGRVFYTVHYFLLGLLAIHSWIRMGLILKNLSLVCKGF